MSSILKRKFLLIGLTGLIALLGMVALRPSGEPGEGTGFGSEFYLLSVFLLGGVWWFRRQVFKERCPKGESKMQCLQQIRLEPGRMLHLVDVEGVRLLLGSGEKGLSLLREWSVQKEESK
jgi:flagellar biogenesis protein FliO